MPSSLVSSDGRFYNRSMVGSWLRGLFSALLLFAAAGSFGSRSLPHPDASATVVLANADDRDSVEIARAYQAFRGIPDENLIFLPVSSWDGVDRAAFVSTIWNPLRRQLLERRLISGQPEDAWDLVGRETLNPTAARFRYMVVCRGVPFRVTEQQDLDDAHLFPGQLTSDDPSAVSDSIPVERLPAQLQKNYASVDSELALLLHDHPPMTGLVPNPLFRGIPGAESVPIVRVTRLDGPSLRSVLRMIRNVQRAETIGLRGRAYFDLAQRKGSYAVGDQWIERAAALAERAGFDTVVDRQPQLMPVTARFDAPALYFGWYAAAPGGVFELPDLHFPPGAIAVHLHSSSASRLRDSRRGWAGFLVEAGVTATVGNVHEPYLEQTHHLDVLLEALLEGMNFGDAAYAAVPGLSWQTVAIGDPLYRPALVELDTQAALLGDLANAASDPYVVMRQMNRSALAGEEPQAARTLALRAFYRTPGPALAVKLAQLEAASGDTSSATRRLGFAARVAHFEAQDWALFHHIALRLLEWDATAEAANVLENLLADERLPTPLRMALLNDGVEAARLAGRHADAVAWRRAWHELKAADAR